MEGYWGMGSTISSYSASRRLDTGTPGGGIPVGRQDDVEIARRKLADRIEDNLATMLKETERLLKDNRREILSLAHALESNKTLTGDDVAAVIEVRMGTTVDGRIYGRAGFFKEIEAYHRAVVVAHQAHSKITLSLPLSPDQGNGAVSDDGSPWASPVAAIVQAAPPNGSHEQPAVAPAVGLAYPVATPLHVVPPELPAPPPFPAPVPPPAPAPTPPASVEPEPPAAEAPEPSPETRGRPRAGAAHGVAAPPGLKILDDPCGPGTAAPGNGIIQDQQGRLAA